MIRRPRSRGLWRGRPSRNVLGCAAPTVLSALAARTNDPQPPVLRRSRVPPSVLASPTATSLIATAVLFVSFAAYSAPVQMPALTKEPAVGYAEPTPASPAGEQQDSVVVPPESRGSSADLDDRSYLVETASPGATMVRQGPALAIARLNPEFATRLAAAIREARDAGLPSAGIFSAYRPPVFGIGGFADKFNSLHSYGLAVDMSGIGEPGSKDARLWHEIAARHGVFCPYGADNRKEWNHCQDRKSVV